MRHRTPASLEQYERLRRRWFKLTSLIYYLLFAEGILVIVMPGRWRLARDVVIISLLITALCAIVHQAVNGTRLLFARKRRGMSPWSWSEQPRHKSDPSG